VVGYPEEKPKSWRAWKQQIPAHFCGLPEELRQIAEVALSLQVETQRSYSRVLSPKKGDYDNLLNNLSE
jgi:hypothetical protein